MTAGDVTECVREECVADADLANDDQMSVSLKEAR
jgi:hypothetical protein